MRCFLKGDAGYGRYRGAARMTGSPDLYDPVSRGGNASVNFSDLPRRLHALIDLYSYNQKHNEANGWDNTDGFDDNNSWNCGVEGDTDDPAGAGPPL